MTIKVPPHKWNRVVRYAIAPIAVGFALGCRLALNPFLQDSSPFMYFIIAVIVSGWLGGWGPGLIATILSIFAVDYFYLPPVGSILRGGPAQIIQIISFLILGVAGNAIVTRLMREKERAEKATREAWEGEAEARRAENALKDSEQRLADIIEFLPDATFALDIEGKIIAWNKAMEKLTGASAVDVLGRGNYEHGYRIYGERAPTLADVVLTGGEIKRPFSKITHEKDVVKGEIFIPHLKANGLWFSIRVAPIYDAQGNIVGVIDSGRDITERKRAEEALREAYGRLQAFFDQRIGGIGIVRATTRGDIVQANDYYLNMVGLTRAELEAGLVRWAELTAPEWHAATEKALAQVRETGVCDTYEKEYVRRDGTRIPVLLTYAKLPGQEEEFVAFVLDITERKESEKALLLAKEDLEQRVEERTAQLRSLALDLTRAEQLERKRLAMVLHENLQQLLVGAKIGLEMAGRKTGAQDIRQSLNDVVALLDEAIGASRSLTVELAPPILYEAGLVAGINWLGRRMGEKYGLIVKIDSDEEIVGDTEDVYMLLFQCVRELLLNVVKHSGVKSAQVSVKRKDDHIRIIVTDQGVGFDPARTESKEAGFGFGLFSIRERLRLMGGQMEVESAPLQGVRVLLVAPLPTPANVNQ